MDSIRSIHHRRQRVTSHTDDSYPQWLVIRYCNHAQNLILAQFQSRTQAETHLQFLQRVQPMASYAIAFDLAVTLHGHLPPC